LCRTLTLKVVCAELNEVREGLEKHKVAIMMLMVYYSSLSLGTWDSGSMKQLDLDLFRNMVQDFQLIDPQSPTCRSLQELDSVFAVRCCSLKCMLAMCLFVMALSLLSS
jgi:hypothetical protein